MLAEKNICSGCGACAAGCPLNCIEMRADSEGFRYPVIDADRCISCGKCEALCPVCSEAPTLTEILAYGAKHRDDNIRAHSSSGGVFPVLAAFVLENGGAVCGAAYDADFSVEHQIIEKPDDIIKLQGAKYAQSRTEHLFPQLRSMLEADRSLLFVGTPCQTAGLKAYLRKDYPNLLLVDMICHGVPSPKAWETYLEHRSQADANGSPVSYVNQRDKSTGWSNYRYSLRIDYQNGQTYSMPQGNDMYLLGFVNNLFLRPSCSQCSFKGASRCSDFTLGDYWGVWDQHPQFDDNKGVSLVLVNTEKGRGYWDRIQDRLRAFPVDPQAALALNTSACHSSIPHKNRESFFARLDSSDFPGLVSELLFGTQKKPSLLRRLLRKLLKR